MTRFINWAKQYNKLWIAVLGASVSIASLYFGTEQWFTITINLLTALGVYTVANK